MSSTSLSYNSLNNISNMLKGEAACGPDHIHNLMLKNLPLNLLEEIIDLFNLSLQEESSVFNLRIYGNRIENLKEIKFLERCNSRLNLIKILSNKKWGLDLNTLGNLYKSLIGSIPDYSFPCPNSLSETNIK
ncbi:hypothetical protein BpHYR1_025307, partial [Brachionus plicatilis]